MVRSSDALHLRSAFQNQEKHHHWTFCNLNFNHYFIGCCSHQTALLQLKVPIQRVHQSIYRLPFHRVLDDDPKILLLEGTRQHLVGPNCSRNHYFSLDHLCANAHRVPYMEQQKDQVAKGIDVQATIRNHRLHRRST